MWALKLGAKAPLEWTDTHEEQLRLSDTLWDDLRWVWIRARWLQEAAEDATGDAELMAARAVHRDAEARVDAAFDARRKARQRARKLGVGPEIEAEIKAAIAARKETRTTLYAAAKRVRATIRPQLLTIWQARDKACRGIAAGKDRRFPQLHWAQCNDVLARYTTAAHEAAKMGRIVRPSHSHPLGSLYVQLQAQSVGGRRVAVEGKKRARIEGGTLVGTTWGALTTDGRTAQVRVDRTERPLPGSAPGRWAVLHLPLGGDLSVRLPVRLHREPPADALVKGVRIVRRGHAWHAFVSIAAEPMTTIRRGSGVLYGGANWRRTPDGLRVFDGIDETGRRVQVCLPREHLASVVYQDALAGALDRAANEAAERMISLLPDRLGEIAEMVRRKHWRGLRDVALETGDADLRSWVRGTPARERHAALLRVRREIGSDAEKYAPHAARILGDIGGRDHVDGLRGKTIRRREDLYRRAAKWLAERYGRIVVAKSDGRALAKVEDEETGQRTDLPLPARRARQASAPYLLLSAIRWAATRAGGDVIEAPAHHYSHTCPVCGSEMERSKSDAAALMLRCDMHGVWDRDHALALALWRDAAPDDRERWDWHAEAGKRSRAEIVRVDAEVERDLRGHGIAHSRLRYVSGVALADGRES